MMKRIVVAALSALFLAAVSAPPAFAQATQPAKKETTAKSAKKKASPKQQAQRQKMKDCAAKWKASGEKGRAAHRKFMGSCLKG